MEKRDEALVTVLGSVIEAANLDLDEDRTDGKTAAAMPELIKVLEAILKDWEIFVSENGGGGGELGVNKK